MITLIFSGHSTSISKAVQRANEILASDIFYEKIASLPQMCNTRLSSPEIATILKTTNRKIIIQTFWNPFGAKTKNKSSYGFLVNRKKISTVTAYAVNTLINETIHAIGSLENEIDLSKLPYDEEEENIFPWKIGVIAEIISRAKRYA
ncbi:hypothetical protein ACI6PS_01960 [Flavobacterium sp. PLA-1-15]|uniref:hypothetical protein n=1 Tax=Flavobacterium sp. PLA-1-15 TaxID=3380533 RepID=UPI003B7DE09A